MRQTHRSPSVLRPGSSSQACPHWRVCTPSQQRLWWLSLGLSLLSSSSSPRSYGKPDATHEEILAAARAAHADEFVQQVRASCKTMPCQPFNMVDGSCILSTSRPANAAILAGSPCVLVSIAASSSVRHRGGGARPCIERRAEAAAGHRTSAAAAAPGAGEGRTGVYTRGPRAGATPGRVSRQPGGMLLGIRMPTCPQPHAHPYRPPARSLTLCPRPAAACACLQILVLDEVTSALDVTSERYINDTLRHLAATKLIIAHR